MNDNMGALSRPLDTVTADLACELSSTLKSCFLFASFSLTVDPARPQKVLLFASSSYNPPISPIIIRWWQQPAQRENGNQIKHAEKASTSGAH